MKVNFTLSYDPFASVVFSSVDGVVDEMQCGSNSKLFSVSLLLLMACICPLFYLKLTPNL